MEKELTQSQVLDVLLKFEAALPELEAAWLKLVQESVDAAKARKEKR